MLGEGRISAVLRRGVVKITFVATGEQQSFTVTLADFAVKPFSM
jgi:hypothetical protein